MSPPAVEDLRLRLAAAVLPLVGEHAGLVVDEPQRLCVDAKRVTADIEAARAEGYEAGRAEQARRFGPHACAVLADRRDDTAATYDEWAKSDTMPRAREAWPTLAAHHRAEAARLRAWAKEGA